MNYNVRLNVVLFVIGLLANSYGVLFSSETLNWASRRALFGKDNGMASKTSVALNGMDDVSPQEKLNKLRVEKIDTLYLKTQTDVLDAQQKLVVQLQKKIDVLKLYSKKDSADFLKFLDDLVTGFRYQMQVEQTMMVADYFSFMKNMNSNYVYTGKISQDDRLFINGLSRIIQEAIVRIQALALDLTSKSLSDHLSIELEHGFYDSAIQAQRAYENQKEQNEKQLDRGWWENIQDEGKDFLSEFSTQFTVAVKKEVAKQTGEFVAEIGEDIASDIGNKAIDFTKNNISPSVEAKIVQLGQLLKSEGLSFLFDTNSNVAVIALKQAIRMQYPIAKPEQEVLVNASNDLCLEEKEYLKQRMPKVQKVLNDAFGIAQPLKIAFCCSGGGNRAMIGTLGLFMSASRHNFLQAAVYSVGLSGSSWTIAPWSYLYLKGLINQKSYEHSFKDLLNSFFIVLNDTTMQETSKKGIFFPPMLGNDVKLEFSNQITTRFGYDQHVSMVDIWAGLIGNYALKIAGSDRLQVTWSELYDLAQEGDIPLPLCSIAFDARLDSSAYESKKEVGVLYDWLETGPFEAGSTVLGYIPMKYFGCEFKKGQLVVDMMQHEYPMSFWLGAYGAAFSLTLNDVIDKGLPIKTIDVFGHAVQIPISTWVKRIIDENYGAKLRNTRDDKVYAKLPNFSVGLQHSLLKNNKDIGLFDAGIAFNIPLPLVFDRAERVVDIVIIYDSNPADVQTLKNADAYFKRKNISIPIMGDYSKTDLLSRAMTVFNDPRDRKTYNSTQPTLIYFPTNVDVHKPPFITANFKYTKNNIMQLIDIIDDAFESQVPDMKEILQKVAKARYGATRKKAL